LLIQLLMEKGRLQLPTRETKKSVGSLRVTIGLPDKQ
jgi:hypothetical protein